MRFEDLMPKPAPRCPFSDLRQIIEATVVNEQRQKTLLHNLEIFEEKLKEAQIHVH